MENADHLFFGVKSLLYASALVRWHCGDGSVVDQIFIFFYIALILALRVTGLIMRII